MARFGLSGMTSATFHPSLLYFWTVVSTFPRALPNNSPMSPPEKLTLTTELIFCIFTEPTYNNQSDI